MRTNWLRPWVAATILATSVLAGLTWYRANTSVLAQSTADAKAGKTKAVDDGQDAEQKTIRQISQAFAEAFEKGDAKAVASFWTEQGEYINDDGTVVRGREAIAKTYGELFAKHPKHKVKVEIDSIRFTSKRTAIEEGHLRVQRDKGAVVTSRYSVLHVKDGDRWEMALVREWPYEGATLRDIDWLIGTWATNGKDTEVKTTYRWNNEKTFILMDFVIQDKGQPARKGTATIARDPVTEQLRSWQFESQGGFGEATWSRDGKKWLQDASGTLANGSQMTALNVITPLTPDSFLWQSTNRTLDGDELPDIAPVKVNRVKNEK